FRRIRSAGSRLRPRRSKDEYPQAAVSPESEVNQQRQTHHARLEKVLRLPERQAEGLDFLEHDIAVEHIEHRELPLELLPAEAECPLGAEVDLIPAILKLRVRGNQVDAGRLAEVAAAIK